MDNELHAIENQKHGKIAVLGANPELAGLLELFHVYRSVYDILGVPWSVGRNYVKHPPQPPSQKDPSMRTTEDYIRLEKAEKRRKKRAAKRLKQFSQ